MGLKLRVLAVLDASKKMAKDSRIGMWSGKATVAAITKVENKIARADPEIFEAYQRSDFAKNLDKKFQGESKAERNIRKAHQILRIAGTSTNVASAALSVVLPPMSVVTTVAGLGLTAGDAALTITNEAIGAYKTLSAFKQSVGKNLKVVEEMEKRQQHDVTKPFSFDGFKLVTEEFRQRMSEQKEGTEDEKGQDPTPAA